MTAAGFSRADPLVQDKERGEALVLAAADGHCAVSPSPRTKTGKKGIWPRHIRAARPPPGHKCGPPRPCCLVRGRKEGLADNPRSGMRPGGWRWRRLRQVEITQAAPLSKTEDREGGGARRGDLALSPPLPPAECPPRGRHGKRKAGREWLQRTMGPRETAAAQPPRHQRRGWARAIGAPCRGRERGDGGVGRHGKLPRGLLLVEDEDGGRTTGLTAAVAWLPPRQARGQGAQQMWPWRVATARPPPRQAQGWGREATPPVRQEDRGSGGRGHNGRQLQTRELWVWPWLSAAEQPPLSEFRRRGEATDLAAAEVGRAAATL